MNKKALIILTAALMAIALSFSSGVTIASTGSKSKPAGKATQKMPYTRVDFDVHGSKCPACIRRLVRTLKKSKGVLKVDISIKKPYSGVVVFDHALTNFEKIKKRMKHEKVKPVNVETEGINKVPTLLIPKSLQRKLKMRK